MKKVIILSVLLFFCFQMQNVSGQTRTPTEFHSYSGQYLYDKKTDSPVGVYFKTDIEKCERTSECRICVFNSPNDKTGKSYTVLTSGIITANAQYGLYNEIITCSRQYDNMYNFNSFAEAEAFAKQYAARNRNLKYPKY